MIVLPTIMEYLNACIGSFSVEQPLVLRPRCRRLIGPSPPPPMSHSTSLCLAPKRRRSQQTLATPPYLDVLTRPGIRIAILQKHRPFLHSVYPGSYTPSCCGAARTIDNLACVAIVLKLSPA